MTDTLSLDRLRSVGLLTDLDVCFARALLRMAGGPDEESAVGKSAALAAALASRGVREGQVCLDLSNPAPDPPTDVEAPSWPDAEEWLESLAGTKLVGDAGGDTPLVVDAAGRLYLHRYEAYERRLADELRVRAAEKVKVDDAAAAVALDRLFPPEDGVIEDRQRDAAECAVRGRLTIVVGGPGTGKTTTVVKMLALLAELDPDFDARRVALLAPTGKAAARLQESVEERVGSLPIDDRVRAALRLSASTIHRRLGMKPGSRADFRHDARDPLPVDTVIVDEASMVDLATMTKLVDAIPRRARLVLLGDRRQLASVEAGAVLADLCDAADAGGVLAERTVELERVFRFDEGGGIARLASAIREGNVDEVRGILAAPPDGVRLVSLGDDVSVARVLDAELLTGFEAFLAADGDEARLDGFDRYRILTAHRRGRLGVEAWNRAVRDRLTATSRLERTTDDWYDRRPVMVTRNDPAIGLANGDVGVTRRSIDDDGRPVDRVFFRASGDDRVRSVPASRLPGPESVFAMTVHKSQGSEFQHVCLVLPSRESPILTRELLYTGVTRARERLTIVADPEVAALAAGRPIRRASGLRQRF